MIAYFLSTLLAAALIVGLPVALTVAGRYAIDNHRRGRARVHRGTSWAARGAGSAVPTQRRSS